VKRATGLLKFEERPEDYAGIFKLPLNGFFPLVHTFGMKFSIDILFCNKERKVLYHYKNVPKNRFIFPLKYIFGGCPYLIEFSKTSLKNIQLGDVLDWGSS